MIVIIYLSILLNTASYSRYQNNFDDLNSISYLELCNIFDKRAQRANHILDGLKNVWSFFEDPVKNPHDIQDPPQNYRKYIARLVSK